MPSSLTIVVAPIVTPAITIAVVDSFTGVGAFFAASYLCGRACNRRLQCWGCVSRLAKGTKSAIV
jgi:hypothetical protein